MQQLTAKMIKWAVLFILLALALLCYSMGTMSGFIVLIFLGLFLEAAFWLFGARLFNRKKTREQTRQTS